MKKVLLSLLLVIAFITCGLIIFFYIMKQQAEANSDIKYGVTFSTKYAEYLGLDWKKTYLEILDDLKVRNLRLIAYWDQIEPEPDVYNFSDLDFQINEASKRDAKVILAVGRKLPRWPECHTPGWLKVTKSPELAQLNYLEAVVNRYKKEAAIEVWQVENEPFFNFGECVMQSPEFVKKEVDLVKSLDSSRQVVVTDSGEWGQYNKLGDSVDILGISVYRQVNNLILGNMTLGLPAQYYFGKAKIFGWDPDKVWITELQMEPWLKDGVDKTSIPEQLQVFDARNFNANLKYASEGGFSRVYLWGVEWWAYLKQNGHPDIWNAAKAAF